MPRPTARYVTAVASIRGTVSLWQGGLADLQLFGNPIGIINEVLAKCPDEIAAPETVGLEFIKDPALRESIRLDISSATMDLLNGESKSATVMAGSAVEALLLWALQDNSTPVQRTQAAQTLMVSGALTKRPGADLNRWELAQFIEIAFHLNIIDSDTAAQARLAQNFRNLIHPGRANRLGQICDRATALSAVAAVEHVSRDLAQRYT